MRFHLTLLRLAQRASGARLHPDLNRARFFVNLGGLIIALPLVFFLITGSSAWMFCAYCLALWTIVRLYLSWSSRELYRTQGTRIPGRR